MTLIDSMLEGYEGIVLVKFESSTCAPCKALTREIEHLDRASLALVTINIDEQPDEALSWGVRSVPTLMIFNNGKMLRRKIGFVTRTQIQEMLDDCNT